MKNLKIAFIITSLFFATSSHAMECIPGEFDENFKNADVIFRGKVIERQPFNENDDETEISICWKHKTESPTCGDKIATFSVSKIYKGSLTSEQPKVYSYDGCYCLGSYFDKDQEYIVFANTDEQKYKYESDYSIATVCDGTTPIYEGQEITGLIDKLEESAK